MFTTSGKPCLGSKNPDIRISSDYDVDLDGDDDYDNIKVTGLKNVGDVDGDGVNDLAISSPTNTVFSDDDTDLSKC